MSDSIHDKIRKLLALAGNNPNEHEAASAMEMASRLMLQHGISEAILSGNVKKPAAVFGDEGVNDYEGWHNIVAWGVADLMGTRTLILRGTFLTFAGRPDNIATSVEMLNSIICQIESLYKAKLPKGMSKRERALYRRDFKVSAANRVHLRAWRIIDGLKREKEQAKATAAAAGVTSTAVALIDHRDELLKEVEAMFAEQEVKLRKASKQRARQVSDRGIYDGNEAGKVVKIQEVIR